MCKLGYKKINSENWNKPDIPSVHSLYVRKKGELVKPSGDDWVRIIMKPKLKRNVPKDVRSLYEVARSSMVYGYDFYPLYTLGSLQLTRVCETAVTKKCRQLDVDKKNFYRNIESLNEIGIIPNKNHELWHSIRKLRNTSSHPEGQMLYGPNEAVVLLNRTTKMINYIYRKK